MVQRFPELQRIDQGLTISVISIQLVQILARDQKRGDAFAVVSDAHLGQVTAAAQKIRPSEDVLGFKAVCFQMSHLLPAAPKGLAPKTGLDFLGKMR